MNPKSLSRIYIGLAVLFIAALAVGTFFDLTIAETMYLKDNRAAMIVGFLGFLLFFSICTIFLGVLCRQLLSSGKGRRFKILIVATFSYLYASTSILIGAGILNDQLFADVFSCPVTFISCFLVGTPVFVPLFFLGMHANGNRYDKRVVRKALGLVVIMTLVFLMSTYMNCKIIRPHFRLLENSSGFEPWYHLKSNGKLFMSIPDLIACHSGSFFSGHAMYGILFLSLFPSLSLVFPKLEGKEKTLMIIGGGIGLLVIISRMITGDNYLSDISLGAISAIKMSFSYCNLSKRKLFHATKKTAR